MLLFSFSRQPSVVIFPFQMACSDLAHKHISLHALNFAAKL